MMLIAGVVGFAGFQMARSGYKPTVAKRSPEQILQLLDESEAALNRVYENLASMSPEEAVSRGMAQIQQIDSSYESLGTYQLNTDTERAAQMSVMRSYYLVQSMMPQWKVSFQAQAKRVISLRPESDDAAIARVLLFCSKHNLTSDAESTLIAAIGDEAKSYGEIRHGVGLYSLVAHEFWKNGQAGSAEKVLSNGIAHYKSHGEKVALVNQLIDQGHRKPPEQKMSQAQFMRMQRALENTSVGAGVQFRC
jgi:hypothetical protein